MGNVIILSFGNKVELNTFDVTTTAYYLTAASLFEQHREYVRHNEEESDPHV